MARCKKSVVARYVRCYGGPRQTCARNLYIYTPEMGGRITNIIKQWCKRVALDLACFPRAAGLRCPASSRSSLFCYFCVFSKMLGFKRLGAG